MHQIGSANNTAIKRIFAALLTCAVVSQLLVGAILADETEDIAPANDEVTEQVPDEAPMDVAPAEDAAPTDVAPADAEPPAAEPADEDLTLSIAAAPASANFSRLQSYQGIGSITAQTVGPGPAPGTERIYVSYIYYYNTFELVAVDPATGSHQVFPSPVDSEWGAWAVIAAPDGNVYVGTLPHAHLLRLNPRTGDFVDLGRPSDSEEYIWRLVVGADGKLYGGTYPSAKLVSFDPATSRMEDLGRMDPTEMYLREMGASSDGFIYGGIGFGQAHLMAYEIATGQHRDILPPEFHAPGVRALIHLGVDGRLYGHVNDQYFRLEGWNATPIPTNQMPREDSGSHLSDGRMTWVGDGDTTPRLTDLRTNTTTQVPTSYAGLPSTIFRLGRGPDGMLYGGTMMPTRLFEIDPRSGGLNELGAVGSGEVYSFLPVDRRLLMASYFGQDHAPLMVYEPGSGPGQVREVHYEGQQHDWRPEAMILGPNHRVYVGARAGYGRLGGPLTEWNPDTDEIQSFPDLIEDQDVVSLASAGDLIVGGTTVIGGSGSHPTQSDARLFTFDPGSRRLLTQLVPVPGAQKVTDLVTAPDGLVYGLADRMPFAFDPARGELAWVSARPLDGDPVFNSAAIGPDRHVWGLADTGIFRIDPVRQNAPIVAVGPERITAGFVLDGNNIFFASGSTVYRYQISGTES